MTLRAWIATGTCALAFWGLMLGSLFAAGAFGACRHSHSCWKRVHAKRAHRWCLRHDICIWRHRWLAEEPSWRAWLRSTAWCESRNRAHISTGNGYYGLVQFDYGTWHEAGGHGFPHQATWYEQAVRAIELVKRVGTGRWPVCGR